MKKRHVIIIFLIVCVLFVGGKVRDMRKQIPFQEVIPLDGGAAIVNAQEWFLNDLKITCRDEKGVVVEEASYDHNGLCIIKDLINNKNYTIEIGRTDLKGKLLYQKSEKQVTPRAGGAEYYVLVGASVGKAWNFDAIPERLNLGPGIVFGNRTIYEFDKSKAINALVNLPISVSGVIIKECSAYFPRDIESSKKQTIEWVNILRKHGKMPILATVVPVTKEHDEQHPGRFKSILEFNDFIREYASKEALAILDLEKAVCTSSSDRHLREDYAQADGLHLIPKAYNEGLDKLIMTSLDSYREPGMVK